MSATESSSIFTLSHNSNLQDILAANAKWASQMNNIQPALFPDHNAKGQSPHTLFIGCSDSRYNENCLGVLPGEAFTWKNVANICHSEDLTLKATLEFAIICLKVNKVIICGHTDCGGIKTCLTNQREALPKVNCSHLYKYLDDIDTMYHEESQNLIHLKTQREKSHYLSHCNVKRQFNRIIENPTVQTAVQNGELQVYGLLYNVEDGLLQTVSTYTKVTPK